MGKVSIGKSEQWIQDRERDSPTRRLYDVSSHSLWANIHSACSSLPFSLSEKSRSIRVPLSTVDCNRISMSSRHVVFFSRTFLEYR